MKTVLVLTSSALGPASVSTDLAYEAAANLRSLNPNLNVLTRDIGAHPVPHLTLDAATALRGAGSMNEAQATARALSDELIAELQAADILIIGAPMYNFGIPSTLKAWFDYVLRAGATFRYSEAGSEGLLTGKRALVIESRGGYYSDGSLQSMDSQEPHLRTLLTFIGITDVTYFRAEKLVFGPAARENSIAAVRRLLRDDIRDASRWAA
jgi:FMN-dependent NADH-azoreductase